MHRARGSRLLQEAAHARRDATHSLPHRTVLRGAQRSGAKRVRVHILLDGRDVPDGSSVADTAELETARACSLG